MSNFPKKVGSILRDLRKKANLTQDELGKIYGWGQAPTLQNFVLRLKKA